MSSSKKQANGTGHIRARKLKKCGSVRYDVLVYENGKQRTLKGGLAERKDAEAYLAAWHLERSENGAYVPIDTGVLTVRDIGELFLKTLEGERKDEETSRWNARITTADFIEWPVTQLSDLAVSRWIDTMANTRIKSGKSAGEFPQRSTIQGALQLLRNILRWAKIQGHVATNVAKGVTISESTTRIVRSGANDYEYLHESEVRKIIESKILPQRVRVAFTLLVFTGVRPKDLYCLSWDRVDVPGAMINFRTHKKNRDYVAHLLPIALDAVREWWMKCGRPRTGLVFKSEKGEPHAKGYDWGWASTRGVRIWKKHNRAGELITYRSKGVKESKGWREKIGIGRPVALYALRHTCASHLLLGTELFTGGRIWSLPEIASHLGHADTKTVERYAKTLGTTSRRAVEESRVALKKVGAREGI